MSANSSTAFLCETVDGRSPRAGDPLRRLVYGNASRLVVSGFPCRVGEVNAVVVSPDALRGIEITPRIGSIKLFCNDSVSEEFVQFEATWSPVAGIATNRDRGGPTAADVFAPWINSDAPPGLDVFATHLGTTIDPEYFLATITSSIDGHAYVNTFDTFPVFLVYAGEGRLAAGYHDGSGVVLYARGLPPGGEYKDAKPLRTPVFRIEQTSSPARPLGPTTTQAMGIASARADRVGALDRKSSPTTTGAATHETRRSHACDNNGYTLAQRKVDRAFFQDTDLWRYDTSVSLTIPEQSVPPSEVVSPLASISATPSAGSVFAGSWQADVLHGTGQMAPASYGGWSIGGPLAVYDQSLQAVSVTPGGSDSRWLSGVDLTLAHSLNDGSKTFPNEWHGFEEWTRSPVSSPAPDLEWSSSVSTVFQRSFGVSPYPYDLATKTVEALQSFDWSSYYVLGTQFARIPRAVQASFYVLRNSPSLMTLSARLRFTYEVHVSFFRAYYSLSSASYALLPPEQTFLAGPDYRVDATFGYGSPSLVCTRKYAGVGSISVTESVPAAKWRQFAQGQQVEITDQVSGATCSVRINIA